MINKTLRRFMVPSVLSLVASCAATEQVQTGESSKADTDRFSLASVYVSGVVWDFNQDGSFFDFGGPVGLITKERLDVLSADGTGIELRDSSDVKNVEPERIRSLISQAEDYCAFSGLRRLRSGASIYTNGDTLNLVDFCEP